MYFRPGVLEARFFPKSGDGSTTFPIIEAGPDDIVVPPCNGYAKDGHLILQADHLIKRANGATYAVTRLIVCVCKGHHGWKKWNEARYNEIVRTLLPPDRVAHWDKAHAARYQPTRMFTSDWLKRGCAEAGVEDGP
jgi:hypothetical protein